MQLGANNDIISDSETNNLRSEENGISNQGAVEESGGERSTINGGRKEESGRIRQEDEISFERRVKETFRGNEQRLVTGNTTLVYQSEYVNPNIESGKAYNILKNGCKGCLLWGFNISK